MEDITVKSLKPVAAASAVAASALLLASCSAGQITQTSSQVAAVDGASVSSENGAVAVQDVTVVLNEDGRVALKFTAINQDPSMNPHRLVSAQVGDQEVDFNPAPREIPTRCSVVGDSAEGLDALPQADTDCIQYVETSLDNDAFAYGGTVGVTFTFDTGTVAVDAPVSAPLLPSGESNRELGEDHSGH
ncbi:hypothetical protein M3D57_02065 [Corynebacterium sanguinis]|uniref:hypothetical protein n=1 Tax=Corynebacterium sanguinis TaxID=2594913 RepID=UPI0011862D0F|nr:hypothetical protein [Corynebacterium sanguinis]MCT1426081.1 hypothetical protein [Corynebacterium sanguinis]MCT1628872.1 hypothetical protein [Corynebacterium sanguinis]MCT2046306.1 hypothetical protein [Corynebacterium sanguinis]MDN8576516.1 hypothetical protein [Corynebacterium sanguinis]QDR77587.1 hypothetical protein E3227_05610 [Corynebacterium sanguinis]